MQVPHHHYDLNPLTISGLAYTTEGCCNILVCYNAHKSVTWDYMEM